MSGWHAGHVVSACWQAGLRHDRDQDMACQAPAADRSRCAVFRFDAVLAEQGMKALDLIA
jgi:hypothetical protein